MTTQETMKNQIPQPNYTQLPNVLLDNMDKYTSAEWKVICAIARQTFGWHKQMDLISISQLVKITGLSRQGVVNSIRSLLQSGVLVRAAAGDGYQYGLNIASETDDPGDENVRSGQLSVLGVVNSVDQGSQLSVLGVVNSVDPQKKVKKNRKKEREARNEDTTENENDTAAPEIGTRTHQLHLEDPPGGPKPNPGKRPKRRRRSDSHKNIDPRKLRDGLIPAGAGTTAYEVFREIFTYPLSKAQIREIMEHVKDLDLWRSVVKEWAMAGYRCNNIRGMLDWYDNRGPTNGKARDGLATPPIVQIDSFADPFAN